MSETDLTDDEALDSLTGYDELAIKDAVGTTMARLLKTDGMHALRALIAVQLQRAGGEQGPAAFKAALDEAMQMPVRRVRTFFAQPDPGEEIDGVPESAAGKDDSPSGSPITTSPSSASPPA